MSDTTFTNGVTLTDSAWFQDLNDLFYTRLGAAATKALLQTALRMDGIGRHQNLSLAASVGSSALTITLQSKAAGTPSATDPVRVPFRNATVAAGDYTNLDAVSATTLVISSGSTMGARNAVPFRLWIVAFNDAGTFRLGAINCVTTVAGGGAGSDVTKIYPLSSWGIDGSTAEGGAGGADNAQTFYTGAAVSAKAYAVLGYMSWESGLTTAGTWDAVPTRIQTFGPGISLPGQCVGNIQRSDTATSTTGTTVLPYDNTIPQSGEGDQYMTQAITPSSAANVLSITSQANALSSVANQLTEALFQDATANAIAATTFFQPTNGGNAWMRIDKRILAGTTSATTFKIRIGGSSAGTTTFNGAFNGTQNTFIEVQEIMG